MNKISSKGDQARAEILAAAKRLFLSQGYNGTSMRDIAREAGSRAVAGLYNHFPTKEAIFKALIEEYNPYDSLFSILEPLAASATTAPEYIRRALSAALEVMPHHYDFLQLAQIDMREFKGQHITHMLETAVFPRIFKIMEQVESLPGLKPMEPVVWLRLMAALVIGYGITERIAAGMIFSHIPDEQWRGYFVDALLYGIAGPEEPEG